MKKLFLKLSLFLSIILLISACTYQRDNQQIKEDIPSEVFRNGVMQEKNIRNNDSVNKEDDLLFYVGDDELFEEGTEYYLDPFNPSINEVNPDYQPGADNVEYFLEDNTPAASQ